MATHPTSPANGNMRGTYVAPVPRIARGMTESTQQTIKAAVHKQLIERLDLEKLSESQSTPAGQQQLLATIHQFLGEQDVPLSGSERDSLALEVRDEVFGFGPLEPLLHDPTISDILVNTYAHVYVERRGVLDKTDVTFKDNRHLLQIIDKIVSRIGRRVDESSPMVDARLPDGSRVNVIVPPLAVDGPILSIRRFGRSPLMADDLLRTRMLTQPMLELLAAAVKARLNIIVSGGTGAGKTTILNILSGFISERERIVTIEDSAELQLKQEHVVRLETRPANVEGRGAIKQRDLVINALRMRPDRVILGEVRGEETLDMLQAMNTGHDGSITTCHSNTPRDAISRLETMCLMGETRLSDKTVRQQIASAVHLILQVSRMADGTRRVTHITEITGTSGEVVSMQDIFLFEKRGLDAEGKVRGRFHATGVMPKFAEKLIAAGIPMPAGLLDHTLEI
jgi:pilus assembly protein CpaF